MKTKNLLLALALLMATTSCNGTSNGTAVNAQPTANVSQQSTEMKGGDSFTNKLEQAAGPKAVNADAKLTRSIELIFGHQYHEFKSANERDALMKEQTWVKNTIATILDDYNRSILYRSYAGKIEFVDDLLDRADDLWRLDDSPVTMCQQLDAEIEVAVDRFNTHLALAGLLENAKSDVLTTLLTQEACALQAFTHAAASFNANRVKLNYWGGTLGAPSAIYGLDEIIDAQEELLDDELTDPYDIDDDMTHATLEAAVAHMKQKCEMALTAAENGTPASDPEGYNKTLVQMRENLKTMNDVLPELLKYRNERTQQWAPTARRSNQWTKAQQMRFIEYFYDIAKVIR